MLLTSILQLTESADDWNREADAYVKKLIRKEAKWIKIEFGARGKNLRQSAKRTAKSFKVPFVD
jgi:hypothetical protein